MFRTGNLASWHGEIGIIFIINAASRRLAVFKPRLMIDISLPMSGVLIQFRFLPEDCCQFEMELRPLKRIQTNFRGFAKSQ